MCYNNKVKKKELDMKKENLNEQKNTEKQTEKAKPKKNKKNYEVEYDETKNNAEELLDYIPDEDLDD